MWFVYNTQLLECDNCLLLLPLRGGAIAWGVIMFLYSIAGGIFLLNWGQYLFFVFPEWQIYGGVGIGVAVAAAISILALSNRSYIWIRVSKFIWPFIIVICAVRAIIMIVELQRGFTFIRGSLHAKFTGSQTFSINRVALKDKVQWECAHGGQLWTESAASGYGGSSSFPAGFCTTGFSSIYAAFIAGLVIDLAFQMYMFFLVWRFQKRLEHYSNMKGPFYGGYYNA
ncbi:hypothetical protein BC628DRAFT_1336736 [Trametes gibbosa]|nr:hypothetical protein BC628DRAFT_1336736 [Trametes gibbosa]